MTADGSILDRYFSSFCSGDLEACRACLAPDARVWQNFTGVARGVDDVIANFAAYNAKSSELAVTDVRRIATTEGFVQQHLLIIGDGEGTRRVWPVCVVARIENGLIAHIDQYMDRAGSFDPSEFGEKRPLLRNGD